MLTPCSNWVMRVRRFSSPASKTLRSSALAFVACSYASRALVRSGSCSMNAVAFLVNSFTAPMYVVIVDDHDGSWWTSARTFWGTTAKFSFLNCSFTKDSTSASPSDAKSGLSFEAKSGCAPIASSCFFHIRFTPLHLHYSGRGGGRCALCAGWPRRVKLQGPYGVLLGRFSDKSSFSTATGDYTHNLRARLPTAADPLVQSMSCTSFLIRAARLVQPFGLADANRAQSIGESSELFRVSLLRL